MKGQSNLEIAHAPERHLGAACDDSIRGRATDRSRGLHRLSRPDELRMLMDCSRAVRGRVLRSVPEEKNPDRRLRSRKFCLS